MSDSLTGKVLNSRGTSPYEIMQKLIQLPVGTVLYDEWGDSQCVITKMPENPTAEIWAETGTDKCLRQCINGVAVGGYVSAREIAWRIARLSDEEVYTKKLLVVKELP